MFTKNMNPGLKAELIAMILQQIVKDQRLKGVPYLPVKEVDETLLKMSQLPHDRLRGLVIFAVVDEGAEDGFTTQSAMMGTKDILATSMLTLNGVFRGEADQKQPRDRHPMADLEELLRRGAGDPLRGDSLRGRDPFPGMPDEMLGLAFLMSLLGGPPRG